MDRLPDFRIFYNTTIYPELLRLERKRRRLLQLLFFSVLLLIGLGIFEAFVGIWVLTLVLTIPVTLYLIFLSLQVRKFIRTFKPNIMRLILDFIDDAPNIGDLHYELEKKIPFDVFQASRIFAGAAAIYQGEDYIYGRVGEMDFELCELNVRESSKVRNRLNYVFKGVFLHATFIEEVEGELIIWPRKFRQYLTRSIREFTWDGGSQQDYEVNNPEFREYFMTYAAEGTHVQGILTEPMQEAIVDFLDETGKDLYISIQGEEIYLAITEPKDILEPFIFRSNLSYELVKGFYEDVQALLNIVEIFDQTH